MKLTTLKVSVPVLMMMMFQSGYGVSDWFMDACRELNRGNVFEAQSLFVENNPDSVEMTQQDKNEFMKKNAELIKNAVKSFIPRGFKDAKGELDLRGIELQIDAMMDMMNLTDVTAANIQDSFQKTIVDNFWAWMSLEENKYLLHNDEVKDEIDAVTDVWAHSYVPQRNGPNKDPGYDDFVGDKDSPTDGTVWKFIEVVKDLVPEDPENLEGKEALNSLLSHNYLFKLKNSIGVDFNWVTIKEAINEATGEDEKEKAVIDKLADQAENLRNVVSKGLVTIWKETEVPANKDDSIPEEFLGVGGEPQPGTIMRFIEDSTKTPNPTWEVNWNALISYEEDGKKVIDKLTMDPMETETNQTATLELIKKAALAEEEPEKEVYKILKTRAQELRQSQTEVCWWIPDLDKFSKTTDESIDRAEALKNALSNDSVYRIIKEEYDDSDELAFYLNLFGNWKIGGHASDGPGGESKNPEAEEAFLRKILDTVKGASRIKDVNNAIYSVFGETYEDLLRHSPNDSDLHRQTSLVQAVDEASTAEEKAAAAGISVETLDDTAAGDVVRPIEDIHDIKQIG